MRFCDWASRRWVLQHMQRRGARLLWDQPALAIGKDISHELRDGEHLGVVQGAYAAGVLRLNCEELRALPLAAQHHQRPDNGVEAHGRLNRRVFPANGIAHILVPMVEVWHCDW